MHNNFFGSTGTPPLASSYKNGKHYYQSHKESQLFKGKVKSWKIK